MHVISDNDLFHRLAFENPWWEFKPDTRIQFRNPPKRVYFPTFVERMAQIGDGRVLVLAGPLRAGKTVLMRQMVAHLVERGVAPTAILYCSLTTPSYTAADLATLFEMFCRRYRHGPDAELYVFFDEIQYVPEWQTMMLKLAKMRPRAHVVGAVSACAPATVTGATLHDGRMTVFILPPLTFLEFLRFRSSEEQLFGGGSQGRMTLVQGGMSHLDAEFHRYVNFGGFLEGVLGKADGAPAPTFIRDGLADRVLHKDLASLYGISDAHELNRLLALLAFNTAREITMDDLAKAAGIAKNTLRKYLDYLESAFLIRRVERVDQNAKRFQRAVAFKVYLTAPCLYSALFAPVPANDQFFRRLAETALFAQWLGSESVEHLVYASWRENSIDLVSIDPVSGRPDYVYEIDWNQDYVTGGKKPETLVGFVEGTNKAARSYILTRSVARPGAMRGVEITLAPISLYAYWLQRDLMARAFHASAN